MLISLYGKQYKKSIGVGVLVKYWNAVKKRAKVTADFNGNPVNDEIDRWEEIDEDIHLSSFYDMEETDAPPPHKPCVIQPPTPGRWALCRVSGPIIEANNPYLTAFYLRMVQLYRMIDRRNFSTPKHK